MSLTLRPTGLGLGGVELPGIVPASTDHDGEPHAGRNAPNTRRIIAADGLFAQSPPSTTCKLRRSYFDNDAIRVRSASTDGEISRVSPSGCARRSRHSGVTKTWDLLRTLLHLILLTPHAPPMA